MRKPAFAAFALASSLAAIPARAADAPLLPEASSHRLTLRLGGIAYGSYAPNDIRTHYGAGGGVIFRLIDKVDLEASAFYAHATEEARLPVQALVRRSFYVSRVVRPYVGAGVRMSHVFGAASRQTWGAVTSYGTYLWFAPSLGAYIEAHAAAEFVNSKVVPEAGAIAGLAVGF
jgi:hypothetical protein